ncbi:multidrug efflux SMR transporter [Vibrio sp. 10N.222.52.C12]|uniref:DMT family transporter n=1 Tax=Vibrio sp. 10N.222.52.C12 TaxID=3229630 RepID=UPI00354C21C6
MSTTLLIMLAVGLNVFANFSMKKSYLVTSLNYLYLFLALGALGFSFICYSLALRSIPVSIGYMMLTGGSLIGITLIGVFVFNENLSGQVLFGLGLVFAGLLVISWSGN